MVVAAPTVEPAMRPDPIGVGRAFQPDSILSDPIGVGLESPTYFRPIR